MISSVTTATDTSAASAAMKKSMGMNKDDFMKLFIAQLKYQDPMKPQDPSAMLDQLSQLSMVEQSFNTATTLGNLLTAQNNNMSMTSVSFIGKDITANGNSVSLDGSSPATLNYSQTVPTASTSISIADANGKVVRTLAAGAASAGDTSVSWDGRDNSGALLPAGSYRFTATGTTASGSSTTATSYISGRVDGVSLVGGTPMLTIGKTSVALTDVIGIKGA